MSPPSTKPLVLAALPGSIHAIAARTNLTQSTIRRHLCSLRDEGKAHVQRRKRTSGHPTPIWVLGPGPDAPPLASLTNADWSRKHKKRIKKAIAKAERSGKEDPRYMRHIALHLADKTARSTRKTPQNPFSALFAGVRVPTMNAEG